MTTAAATQVLPVLAAAGVTNDALVVSIHDIAPSNRSAVEAMMLDLAYTGVRVCSLLVVPDYHHQGLFVEDRQFVSWLRDLEARGHEVVVHGYFHQRPRRAGETLADRFVTRFYTQDEGEFYDLGYDEAFDRITRARDLFREAGLTPRGFIAPAWLLSPEGERAVRDAEFEYTTWLRTIRDLRDGRTFRTRSLVYSVQAPWRRRVSLAWNSALRTALQNQPLMRVSLHPPDRLYPRVWRHILDSLNEMQAMRTATTYRDWLAEQRIQSMNG
jgi:predicted deacetylase